MAEARFQRRRQRALTAPAVVEPRGAIACLALAAQMAEGPAGHERSVDLLAPVGQFPGPHHLPGGIVDHCQPADPAARGEPYSEWVRLRVWHGTLDHQGERVAPPDRRLPL